MQQQTDSVKEAVHALLMRGRAIPPLSLNENGVNPLHHAIYKDQQDLVALYLAAGASLTAPCRDGYCAIHYCMLFNRPQILQTLLDHKADISLKTKNALQETALMIATHQKKEKCLTLLFEHDLTKQIAEKNQQSHETALYSAVVENNIHAATLLLTYNSTLQNAPTKTGYTPLSLALILQRFAIATKILDALLRDRATFTVTEQTHLFKPHANSLTQRFTLWISSVQSGSSPARLLPKCRGRLATLLKKEHEDNQDNHRKKMLAALPQLLFRDTDLMPLYQLIADYAVHTSEVQNLARALRQS